jgi:hypothetical protein
LFLLLLPSVAKAQTYDAAADFTISSNPIGPWAYGTKTTPGTAGISYFTDSFNVGGAVIGWNNTSIPFQAPFVARNISGTQQTFETGTFNPGQLFAHPDSSVFSTVRFSALPGINTYNLDVTFTNLSTSTGQQVFVYHNGDELFAGLQTGGFNTTTGPATTPIILLGGDVIDIMVGRRLSGTSDNTYTGISASLTPVPEPASVLAVSVLAATGVAGLRRRMRRNG